MSSDDSDLENNVGVQPGHLQDRKVQFWVGGFVCKASAQKETLLVFRVPRLGSSVVLWLQPRAATHLALTDVGEEPTRAADPSQVK